MKQYITEEQFLSLSDKGMDNYRDYFLKNIPIDKMMYCNIGQMIEILGKHNLKIEFENGWSVETTECITEGRDELCDALWEAVREIL